MFNNNWPRIHRFEVKPNGDSRNDKEESWTLERASTAAGPKRLKYSNSGAMYAIRVPQIKNLMISER